MTSTAPSHYGDHLTPPSDPHPLPTIIPEQPQTPLQHALVILHYVYPLFLLFFFLGALTWWGIRLSSKRSTTTTSSSSQPPRPAEPTCNLDGSPEESSETANLLGKSMYDGNESTHNAFGRLRAKFAAWFNGDLEGPSGNNNRMDESGDSAKYVGLTPIRKALLSWGLLIIILSFMAECINIILHALVKPGWWCGQDVVISNISLLFIYALILLSQLDTREYPTVPHVLTWAVGLAFEIALLVMNIINYNPSSQHQLSSYKILVLAIEVFRIVIFMVTIALYIALVVLSAEVEDDYIEEDDEGVMNSNGHHVEDGFADEATGLLASRSTINSNGNTRSRIRKRTGYGTVGANGNSKPKPTAEETAGWARKNLIGVRQSWWEYLRGYTVFFPYLWPSESRGLQFLAIICFIIVSIQRVVNMLVPDQLGKVTDLLTEAYGNHTSPDEPPVSALARIPWMQISLYIVFRFLQGSMGLLGAIRSTLWIPIGQYSYQALSTSAFEHVHSLSLDFHLGKKTGEVLSALSKGSAINNFLEMVTFQVVPMFVDLGLAVAYFLHKFDAYYALIVAIVTFCYLYITIRMAQWRADIRREMTNKSREEDAVKNDSMIAYETVKYFNAETYEFSRYRNAVRAFQRAEYQVLFSLNVMNVSQNVMFMIGLLLACILSAWQVTMGQIKVGQFVSLLTYLAQLQGPLNFFGTFYRSIQSSMINSERMLELFKEKPTVVDAPTAKPLDSSNGEIEFDDVWFSYDRRKPALRGFSFTARPGTTTAFVGESGGGKTTILRLLFRFYNVDSGAIKIDGKDVRDVTIDSLRQQVGVVPQDTVLFNETIMYNLRYANANATDEDVFAACRAARIHDKILTFPDGYATKVGERGLRLSGGEKQRVAIARTILKNPRVILLDEATAALDSETEQYIQKALAELSRGRTTLVIAHRLSTITTADQILCIHQGRVVERGTHEELLALGGRYAMMWAKQVRAEQKMKVEAVFGGGAETSGSDGEGSPVVGGEAGESDAEVGGEALVDLSDPPTTKTTVGRDQTAVGPVPRSQEEAVDAHAVEVADGGAAATPAPGEDPKDRRSKS